MLNHKHSALSVLPKAKTAARKKIESARIDKGRFSLELAKARIEQAEMRAVQAKTRAELAETRTEQAETRIEMAKTRAEQAETRSEQAQTRAEQVETILQHVIHKEFDVYPESHTNLPGKLPIKNITVGKSPLDKLSLRQREILQLIAEGQNTKQIGEILKVSPKTVEYHRTKLMNALKIHDVPGLVRISMRAGLIPPEK
ncbi:MAG TPA: LuxR C-terminal-related transcriptional regulator [Verrucomicrobiae bacterium]|nr:LuxR C-terminal-related transcriptional regulator [Verrucomicrobiae bacterium]